MNQLEFCNHRERGIGGGETCLCVPEFLVRGKECIGGWGFGIFGACGKGGRLVGWTDGWYISRACLNMDHSPSDSSMTSWVSLCKETTKCFTYLKLSNLLNLKNSIVFYILSLRHWNIKTLNTETFYFPIRFWEEKHASIIHVMASVSTYAIKYVFQ